MVLSKTLSIILKMTDKRNAPKMALQTPGNYQGYSKKYTRNGFICYYFNDRRTSKAKMPKEVLNTLPSDREVAFTEILRRTKNKPYTGFTFLPSRGRKIYMFNGERIPKRIITDKEFERMRNLERIWKAKYEEYSKSNNQSKEPNKEPNENKADPPKERTEYKKPIPSNPYDLLKEYGINNRKDWRRWMLKNHPDKNPNTDIELVKLINMAVKIVFV